MGVGIQPMWSLASSLNSNSKPQVRSSGLLSSATPLCKVKRTNMAYNVVVERKESKELKKYIFKCTNIILNDCVELLIVHITSNYREQALFLVNRTGITIDKLFLSLCTVSTLH